MCAEVCPVEAITIDQVARVDTETCIDCGSCLVECPNDAISMEEMETAPTAQSSYLQLPSRTTTARDKAITNPCWTCDGKHGFKQVKKGGLLGQIFDFFGRPTGQGRGRGRGLGGRGFRGKGRRNW